MSQLNTKILPIPAFHDNYIWAIVHPSKPRVVVVDPGDHRPVEAFLKKHQLQLAAILITHHHADHMGGVAALVKNNEIPVYGPASISVCNHPVENKQTICLRDFSLTYQVMAIPGHTLDHIAYVSDDHVFCGDTLFSVGCGRVFEGTMTQMLTSLDHLSALPGSTRVYCAHEYTQQNIAFAQQVEPHNQALKKHAQAVAKLRAHNQPSLPSTLKLEREINPFLRVDEAAVKQAAEKQAGEALTDREAVFACIRRWKDKS